MMSQLCLGGTYPASRRLPASGMATHLNCPDSWLLQRYTALKFAIIEDHILTSLCLVQTKPRILYLNDYLPTSNAAQTELIDSFVQDLEQHLGVERTVISLADMWRKTAPESAKEIELRDYMTTVSFCRRSPYCDGVLTSSGSNFTLLQGRLQDLARVCGRVYGQVRQEAVPSPGSALAMVSGQCPLLLPPPRRMY